MISLFLASASMHSFKTESQNYTNFVFYSLAESNLALTLLTSTFAHLKKAGLLADRYLMTAPRPMGGPDSVPSVTPDEALEVVSKLRTNTFRFRYDVGGSSQGIGLIPQPGMKQYYCFNIGTQIPEMMPPSWSPLIELLTRTVRLALAGTHNPAYIGWQRCADAEYYSKRYGSIEGFRRMPLLPPPLDDVQRLDVSNNPGRFDSVNGGPAFVCSDLWLGPTFWDYAPCLKEEILAQPWLELRETPDFLYIKSYPEPFTRPDGEQGEIQRRLWQILFHSDCRWPPNSEPS